MNTTTNATCFTFPVLPSDRAIWVADPSCRGTFTIISLCLSTTVICIWSAVHRDIPLVRLSWLRSLVRDAPLVLVALFAPEVLFYFAFNQYLRAKELAKIGASFAFQGLASGDAESLMNIPLMTDGSRRQHAFTLTHGFYATMGGFVLDDGNKRTKLTHQGVRYVMMRHPDAIPDLPLTSITDRSKSNGLGKALLVVQVTWLCLNCVSRLAERLPLSLLELTTLAHGLFTLSSYAVWWHKPLGIDEPTVIRLSGDVPRISSRTTDDAVPKFRDLFWAAESAGTFGDAVITTVIPLIYGLLHFLGRNSHFPTMIEQRIWTYSSVVVMSSGAVFFLAWFFILMKSSYNSLAFNVIPFIYSFGAAYLLVESTRQVFYLQLDAFKDASWSYYVPHWL